MNLFRAAAGRRAKWFFLAGWTAILLLLASSALDFNDAQQDRDADYLPQSAQSTEAIRLEEAAFGDELLTGMLVYQSKQKLTKREQASVTAAAVALGEQPLAGQYGKAVPVFLPDGRTAVLHVQVRAEGEKDILYAGVERLRELAAGTPSGVDVRLSGQMGLINDQVEILDSIDGRLLTGTVLLISILLLLIYRSPALWLLPLSAVGVAEVVARGIGTEMAGHGTTITSQSAALMTVLVFGVGTDYALLLIARYRDELRRNADRHAAMSEALARSGPTILASAGTVVTALLCMLLADVNATSGAGPIGALGIIVTMLAMLTLLPPLLLVFGRGVFWPFIPRFGDADVISRGGLWTRLADLIARRPLRVVFGVVLVMVVMASGLTARPGGLDLVDSFHKPVDSVTGMKMLERVLPPGATGPMSVLVPEREQVPRVLDVLRSSKDVAGVDNVQEARGTTRVEVVLNHAPYSDEAIAAVDRLRPALTKASKGNAYVAGASAIEADMRRSAVSDNRLIMPLVLVVVFLVLLLLLRALVAPIVLMLTVVASFVAAVGASWWSFVHIFGFGGVDKNVLLFVFIFLVALGIDYNIFLMARVREEALRHGAEEGMRRGLVMTGGVITSAGIVLAGTFFVLASMPITILTEIGFAIAIGVLFDALVVRSMLVPALAFLLGRKLWWPLQLPDSKPVGGPVSEDRPERERAGGSRLS